jgi:molybdopterin-synthase adenylyltransferase
VVGAGALGAPAAAYLAVAGVGRIGLVDGAAVDPGRTSGQVVHLAADAGANRAEATALRLAALNPEVHPEPYPVPIEGANAAAIVAGADLVLECSNDEDTRRVVNDASCMEGVPLAEAGVEGLAGFLLSIRPGRSACHRCAAPAPGTRGSGGGPGALGAMAGALGAMQALEGIKLLTGIGEPLLDRVVRIDGADLDMIVEPVERRTGCPACAEAPPERQFS